MPDIKNVASESGRTFGLVLHTITTQDNTPVIPGSVLMNGNTTTRCFLPDSRDHLYWLALMMWCALSGPDAKKFASDTRLPDFVRKTIKGATA